MLVRRQSEKEAFNRLPVRYQQAVILVAEIVKRMQEKKKRQKGELSN